MPVASQREPRTHISPTLIRQFGHGPVRLLALGASTGGIHALGGFFQALPWQIGAPILITQHLPEPFMPVFARQIGTASGREAIVAEDGLRLLPDRIIIAPGDASLTVDIEMGRMVVRLYKQRSASGCLPSVDPMLASAGHLLGRDAVGVIFSGMGRDGLEGATALVGAGGSVLVQDEETSAVWGMPRVVAEAGISAGIHSPAEISRRIANRIVEASCR
jgi:two-component system chemotaxis response regulator CheB